MKQTILVSGGAGYVGSVLVPELVRHGHNVRVLDTFWFWSSPTEYQRALQLADSHQLRLIPGDIRNRSLVKHAVNGTDLVIQLACVSNDPSSDLDPAFTHSINYEGNILIIDEAKAASVPKFIYTSSSSVYGIKDSPDVTEDMALEPLTQYSRLKAEVEIYFNQQLSSSFHGLTIRPSTVCGYSPRQRLDVVVNLLTDSAINSKKIRVFGGDQLRPNVHIKDIADLFVRLSEMNFESISGKTFNVGWHNLKVKDLAQIVSEVVGDVDMEFHPTNDPRSYHVSSKRILDELGFESKRSVKEAIEEMVIAFRSGKIPEPNSSRYHNVKRLKDLLEHREA